METIMAIAALCSLSVGAMGLSVKKVDLGQLKCQKYYSKCFQEKYTTMTKTRALLYCIDERSGK